MSRVVGLTLLLIILVNILCDNTAASAQLPVARSDIRKCRCRDISPGVSKCPKQVIPTDRRERWALDRCLCRAGTEQNRPELLQFCHRLGSATPL